MIRTRNNSVQCSRKKRDSSFFSRKVDTTKACSIQLKNDAKQQFISLSPQDQDKWVQDKNGNMYYDTEKEAKRQMKKLKEKGEWHSYRVTSFKRKEKTFWRVEMKGKNANLEKKEEEVEEKENKPEPEKPKTQKKVCLTFDDGPQTVTGTKNVLDVLDSEGIKGTFFLTGVNMKSNPKLQKSLVTRMMKNGHKIGNHTFLHNPMSKKGYRDKYPSLKSGKGLNSTERKGFQKQYRDNEDHFKKLIGKGFPGFDIARLPGDGRTFKELVKETEGMGMKHFGWEFEFATGTFGSWLKGKNWKGISGINGTRDGFPNSNDVILFHDRHWAGGYKSHLKKLVLKLKSANFSFGLANKNGKCS